MYAYVRMLFENLWTFSGLLCYYHYLIFTFLWTWILFDEHVRYS